MKIIGSNDVQKNEKGENNVDSTTPNIESSPPLMGIGHSTLISANLKNETKTDINLIKNNISNNNLLKTNTLRPTNLSLPPPTTSTTTKSLLLLTTTTPSSSSLLEPPPPSNNQSKSLPSSLLPSPSFNLPIPFCSDNSESSPSTSMAAATFLSNWRRQSTNKSKKGGDLIKIDKSVENNGIDGNNIKNNGYTLSELSHDVLAQIIRLFPFSSSLTTPTSSSTSSSTNSSSPSQRHIIYRALSQPNPTINTNLKCSSFNEEKKKKEENKSSLNINNNNEDILNNNNKISPKKQLLRDWHTRASSSSLGRKLRRAASTFSGSKIGGVSSKERPKNLSIFGKSEKNGKNAKSPTSCNGALSRLCKVSVDTMAITALPLDCWLKERLKNWVQLSGHQGTIVPASNHSLWKKQPQGSHIEAKAYSQIMLDPALRGITPNFIREIQHRNEVFIEIQDLLAEFPDPSTRAIMDIKIGTRTFLESEVANKNKRVDLYKKMIELAPNEPTEEERQDEAITKLRYMQFRERKSSSATLGFRIEAAQMPGVPIQKNFKQIRTRNQVRRALRHFCGTEKVCAQLAQRLRHIRNSVEASAFFACHEIVGSSILLIHDGGSNSNNNTDRPIKVGAWLIDFAKCHRVEGGGRLTHRRPWDLGNHEDGYLIGLDNLMELLEEDEGEEENEENKEDRINLKLNGAGDQ